MPIMTSHYPGLVIETFLLTNITCFAISDFYIRESPRLLFVYLTFPQKVPIPNISQCLH